jgi:hypothetical protein
MNGTDKMRVVNAAAHAIDAARQVFLIAWVQHVSGLTPLEAALETEATARAMRGIAELAPSHAA